MDDDGGHAPAIGASRIGTRNPRVSQKAAARPRGSLIFVSYINAIVSLVCPGASPFRERVLIRCRRHKFRLPTAKFLPCNADVSSVVFMRAVNVGTVNRCRPAEIAKQLAKLDVVNIGAVGTFVVRKNVGASTLRKAIADNLQFKCEMMIVPARNLIKFLESDPFAGAPSGPDVVRFVSVLAKPARHLPALPIHLPSNQPWGVKVVAIHSVFVAGLYRRHMKAIGQLGKLEKLLGVAGTVRNWNTIQKIALALEQK